MRRVFNQNNQYNRIKIRARMDGNATPNVAKNLRKAVSKWGRASEGKPESMLHHKK